jgi:glutamate racemase
VIGVYDSGFGGLSVLRALRERLPNRDFVYLGDSGRAPYGGRSADTILDFAEQAVERLFEEGCTLIIVACNTVSCVALRHLQLRYAPVDSKLRILGVTIPAAEMAVAAGARTIGVLATARTVASGTYATEIHKLNPAIRVQQRAAPLLAPIVEEGWEHSTIAKEAIRRYLTDLQECDAILLGCTHYPLLADEIQREVRPGVRVLDPSEIVAERLEDWLHRHPGFVAGGTAQTRVLCSGDPAAFATHGARFLGAALPRVEAVIEQHGRLVPAVDVHPPAGQIVR